MREMDFEKPEGFFGEVKPRYGRWVWPFRDMAHGDYFIVDQARRTGEEVRGYVKLRSAQLNKRFSVTVNDPENPGFTRVTCVPWETEDKERDAMMLSAEVAGKKIALWYDKDIDMLPWGTVYLQGRLRIDAPAKHPPSIKRAIFPMGERDVVIGTTFDENGFDLYALPAHTKIENWEPGQLVVAVRQIEVVDREDPDPSNPFSMLYKRG